MSNPRSASNAWAKIRNKLMADGDGSPVKPVKASPKKKAAAAKGTENGEGDDINTPKKTPRKRPAKKQDIDGEGSPQKKGRTPKGKKAVSEPISEATGSLKSIVSYHRLHV